jgi:hypothetical protein
MANTHKGAVGYVIAGVCDKKSSAIAHKKHYNSEYVKYGSYFVNGIDHEAENTKKIRTRISQN